MWTPTPMRQVALVVLDTDLPAVTAELGRLGVLQLFDVRLLGDWATDLVWERASELARGYDNLERRLSGLREVLGLPAQARPPETIVLRPDAVLAEVEALLAPIEAEAGRLVELRSAAESDLEQLDVIARNLEPLRTLAVDLDELRRLRFLAAASALVPVENLERLRGSLESTAHAIIPVSRIGDRVLIFSFAPLWQEEVLGRALRSAYAERVETPADLHGSPEQALEQVGRRREERTWQLRQVAEDLAALGRAHRLELDRAKAAVLANHLAVVAWEQVGRTGATHVLAGWVPAPQAEELRRRVQTATRGRAVVEMGTSEPPARRGQADAGAFEPPVALQNPPLLRPFESIVETYGLPRYGELDPTPVTAGLFLVMFGVMFGDIGQGAVLAAVGALIARGVLPLGGRDFGAVLAAAGLSSMLFGLLFGSVFGSEEVIPAVWFHPFGEAAFFLQVAVAFGIAVISLGVLFAILNARRVGDYRALLLEPYGVVGLWLYWGALVVAWSFVVGRAVAPLAVAFLVGLPLALLYLREPLAARLGLGGAPEATATGATYYVESGVEVFDTVVRYLSNTLSFLRLAAFALSHAGLGVVVFTLAATLREAPLAAAAVLVLGNAIIIALEGLIVGIQALRLQYYEFFGKFFHGGGSPYRPFTIPVPVGTAGEGRGESKRR